MPFANEGGGSNTFEWTVYDGDTPIGTFTFTRDEFEAALLNVLGNQGTSLTLDRSSLNASLKGPTGSITSQALLTATGFESTFNAQQGVNPGAQGFFKVSDPETWSYLYAYGRDGIFAGGIVIDESGLHVDEQGGTDSPVIISSATYSDAAPNAIPAQDASQVIFIFSYTATSPPIYGGTYTLNGAAGDVGPINYNDDQAALQAAFDATYGAGEVTVSAPNGALNYSVAFDGATVDDQRIELLTVSDDSLVCDDTVTYAIRPNPWGKALGLTAAPGSLYMHNDAGTGRTWKKSTTADTGWVEL